MFFENKQFFFFFALIVGTAVGNVILMSVEKVVCCGASKNRWGGGEKWGMGGMGEGMVTSIVLFFSLHFLPINTAKIL